MDRLVGGYHRFREKYWAEHQELFATLAAKGQSPKALVIACCDSRVAPEVIFDAAPGEIFVVRNVAALVPPYAPDTENHGTSAALEFAVRKLQVTHILVIGHSQCGGVQALLNGPEQDDSDFIGPWMRIAEVARFRALEASKGDHKKLSQLCEHETIRVSLENLMTFPWVRERVEKGSLELHGCYFEVERGRLELLLQCKTDEHGHATQTDMSSVALEDPATAVA